MPLVSVVIPSRTERFLDQTIRDVLTNGRDVEVLPILDGYDCERVDDPRVRYVVLPPSAQMQKRHGVNEAVGLARGEYVMALDAHCLVAPGFDEQLARDHRRDWVQIPRRHRLDPDNWRLQDQGGRPPIDYEYFMWRGLSRGEGLHGYKWDGRTLERADIEVDDALTFQGSCWFMSKDWYHHCGFMETDGYTGWGQEAEEIGLGTRLHGGQVKVNKRTYYAHLHKGTTYGRMYRQNRDEVAASYQHSMRTWLGEHRDFFIEVLDRFMPIPNFPGNWKDRLWRP